MTTAMVIFLAAWFAMNGFLTYIFLALATKIASPNATIRQKGLDMFFVPLRPMHGHVLVITPKGVIDYHDHPSYLRGMFGDVAEEKEELR